MSRMIDLIRQSAVPANIMRSAARGALSLPSDELLEILVYLANHPIFRDAARMTLASWDEKASLAAVSDPATPAEVLDYFAALENLRPRLLPPLLENSAVRIARLVEMARSNSRELLTRLLSSPRARSSRGVLEALATNPQLTEEQTDEVRFWLRCLDEPIPEINEELLAVEANRYLQEHAVEMQAAEGGPFFLHGWTMEEQAEIAATLPPPSKSRVSSSSLAAKALVQNNERLSAVQKIARLNVGERVLLALKGNRDERFILIRDGARLVSDAVLESPKLTEGEVEMFASMKNVNESVLRAIANKRRFIKNYAVIRLLTSNPRCPLEVSIPLVKHLLVKDIKNLSSNKNVPDTLRKLATKLFRDRVILRKG
jgi:hypothetical protein